MTGRGPGWELHHGDCLAGMRELADSSVDVVITDPPYEVEAHTKGKRQGKTNGCGKEERGKRYARVVDAEFDFVPMTETLRVGVATQIARVTRRCAYVFCQVEAVHLWRSAFADTELHYRRTIPWVKPDAQPSLHGKWPGQAFEAIVLVCRTGAELPVGGKARYYQTGTARGPERAKRLEDDQWISAHPTQKPLELLREQIVDLSLPGEIVCDPFAGSGTTGVACCALGRRFIGWELDAKYHALAVRRLSGAESSPRKEQPGLFDALTGTS